MRIKSGGPGKTQGAQGTKGAQGVKKTTGAKFSDLVGDDNQSTDDKARQIRAALLEQLTALAQELENGKATKEEASRRFAGMVISERFGNQERTKGGKKMVESIGDLVESDPNFVNRLQEQLKKLAKA
jgi:hypothetical protein